MGERAEGGAEAAVANDHVRVAATSSCGTQVSAWTLAGSTPELLELAAVSPIVTSTRTGSGASSSSAWR